MGWVETRKETENQKKSSFERRPLECLSPSPLEHYKTFKHITLLRVIPQTSRPTGQHGRRGTKEQRIPFTTAANEPPTCMNISMRTCTYTNESRTQTTVATFSHNLSSTSSGTDTHSFAQPFPDVCVAYTQENQVGTFCWVLAKALLLKVGLPTKWPCNIFRWTSAV